GRICNRVAERRTHKRTRSSPKWVCVYFVFDSGSSPTMVRILRASLRTTFPGNLALVRRDPLPKHLLQDPAVAHVVDVDWIVNPRERTEGLALPVGRGRLHQYLR